MRTARVCWLLVQTILFFCFPKLFTCCYSPILSVSNPSFVLFSLTNNNVCLVQYYCSFRPAIIFPCCNNPMLGGGTSHVWCLLGKTIFFACFSNKDFLLQQYFFFGPAIIFHYCNIRYWAWEHLAPFVCLVEQYLLFGLTVLFIWNSDNDCLFQQSNTERQNSLPWLFAWSNNITCFYQQYCLFVPVMTFPCCNNSIFSVVSASVCWLLGLFVWLRNNISLLQQSNKDRGNSW